MKSIPNMIDMRRSDADKMSDGVGMMTSLSDLPDYDCGLCLSFNKESLDKLDMENDVHVGDYVHIHAFAKVTGVNMQPGSDEIDRVSLCLTHISAESEDEENEETEYEAA